MATKGVRVMNDNICVMCGAELPTECGKQYCAECEKAVEYIPFLDMESKVRETLIWEIEDEQK